MVSLFSRVWLCATLWTVARQAPLSMGLSMQKNYSSQVKKKSYVFSEQERPDASCWAGNKMYVE